MSDKENDAHHVVTVNVADPTALRMLGRRGLDLFSATARRTATGAAIEGRLSEREIAGLRQDGHEVEVHPGVDTPPLPIAPDTEGLRLADGQAAVPAGYSDSSQLYQRLRIYADALPGAASVIELPERSVQGTKIPVLRFRRGTRTDRPGVLLLGGVHARELMNPEILDNWMFRMAYAIEAQTSVNYQGSQYGYSTISLLIDSLDIFVVPLVNPDGHDYVMAAESQRWWRKNRAPLPVDLNRNYDFLFDSGIGTSTDPNSEVYRGSAAFSEPETRNIRWLLDTFPHITAALDLHSYSELILYPWGDDDDQTTDPAQNFRVPNADRGIPNDGRYREYIPAGDLNWFVRTGNRMRDAISKARGRAYTVQQSVGLYPTTGTVDDYAFSRHFVNPALKDVRLICVETGIAPPPGGDVLAAFQPPGEELRRVRDDVGPALMEFLIEVMCPTGSDAQVLSAAQSVLERHLPGTGDARALHDGLVAQGPAILRALGENPRARVQATTALKRLIAVSEKDHDPVLAKDVTDKLAEAATSVAAVLPDSGDLLHAFAKLTKEAEGTRLSALLA
ncbi:Zinc carboxypeptidase [Amycolatopsis xylanica]|uniref:Zinc carboxypeptidase n=1 Tax=Amycolatopsis xylanica TaxID=589385 RepID=A0A1H3RDZ2_9PSEU|nr:M14 family zinc carboxypeptidase [Amycolatopsis xylanica]SDZ23907.1 Zinc carboxypeptidase [Amycolatopsis xylanica]